MDNPTMQRTIIGVLMLAMMGCAAQPVKQGTTRDRINETLEEAAKAKPKPVAPEAVTAALLPPLQIEMPKAAKPIEQKFDLVVNNAPASQVFMGIVSGTRYSMLVHPEVAGTLSVNLKDVTVFEALDAIRELYGYEYKVTGTRIFIQPLTMQTRLFQVNYPTALRRGISELRVISGSIADSGSTGGSAAPSGGTASAGGGSRGASAIESSRIATTTTTDFWSELAANIGTLVGCKVDIVGGTDRDPGRVAIGCDAGKSVVVSPHSGMIAVRAMPVDLRSVSDYLRAAQIAVERQVMLEAKILEVQLDDGYQTGINWAAFKTGNNHRVSAGQLVPGTVLGNSGPLVGGSSVSPNGLVTGTPIGSDPGKSLLSASSAAGTLFGLAFQTSNFAALLSFLETQGTVHVLSSPRIATLNNQKAVLKVGTDEFFVTEVSTNTTSTGTTTTTTPSVTVQPFFSGIALDVTPQIDENDVITLHVHPSVSQVTTVHKDIRLGESVGTFTLPLASSNVSETDSIVRVRDGEIVAIGGLMRQSQTEDRSQVPGLGDVPGVGTLFRQTVQASRKRELVILIKPTVIQSGSSWNKDIRETQQRMRTLDRGFSYGAKTEVFGVDSERP